MYHMADLMADDRHQFVVVHQVHQGAEYADRTVAAGEGIDVHDLSLIHIWTRGILSESAGTTR